VTIHITRQEEINIKLTDAITFMSSTMKAMSKDVKEINISQHEQKVLLEKMNNMDDKINHNNVTVHKRLDKIEKTIDKEIQEIKTEHINPIKTSLDYAWKFIFSKLFAMVVFMAIAIYNLVLK